MAAALVFALVDGVKCLFLCRIDGGAFAFAPPPMMAVCPFACLGEIDKCDCCDEAVVVVVAVVVVGLAVTPC